MATRTMKGIYVKRETTAINRHRKRQDFASTRGNQNPHYGRDKQTPTVFYLRIIDNGDCLLQAGIPSGSSFWNWYA